MELEPDAGLGDGSDSTRGDNIGRPDHIDDNTLSEGGESAENGGGSRRGEYAGSVGTELGLKTPPSEGDGA